MVSRKRRDSSRRRSRSRRSRGRRRPRDRRERGSSSKSSNSSSSGSQRKGREKGRPSTSRFGGLEAQDKSTQAVEEQAQLAVAKAIPPVEANGAGGAYRVIPTPGNLIGGLMGRGGATITGIRKNHPGVTIKVNQPAGHAMAQIIITGDPKMVPSAEVAVCDALMSSPSKGPTPVVPGRGMPLTMSR
mmetsp:Transcript_107387/g.131026  ORF Transcript_107387/g.131026 Transcript_107387/m.131026 type:complete len:187 (-) Transcript_107387:79-639(-)